MQVAFAGTGVWLADSVTNIMPVAKSQAKTCLPSRSPRIFRRSIRCLESATKTAGIRSQTVFTRGWDPSPPNHVSAYGGFSFFLEGLETAVESGKNFAGKRPHRRRSSEMS
ncbi:MAG: hypothetical protein IPG67_14825 [Acidobacteria bacterium]|nr:hypothetical protein [Acidobacteriota bacterium]